jgi:hypothetical protein
MIAPRTVNQAGLALSLVFGLAGCSSLERRSQYGLTTRTVPVDASRSDRRAMDPFQSRASTPSAAVARYFPGLVRPYGGVVDDDSPTSFSRRVPVDDLPETAAVAPPRRSRGLDRPPPADEPAPLLPVALVLQAHPDDESDAIEPPGESKDWRSPPRPTVGSVSRDAAAHRAGAVENAPAEKPAAGDEPDPDRDPVLTGRARMSYRRPGDLMPDLPAVEFPPTYVAGRSRRPAPAGASEPRDPWPLRVWRRWRGA